MVLSCLDLFKFVILRLIKVAQVLFETMLEVKETLGNCRLLEGLVFDEFLVCYSLENIIIDSCDHMVVMLGVGFQIENHVPDHLSCT